MMHHDQRSDAAIEPQTPATMTPIPTTMTDTSTSASVATAKVASSRIPLQYWYRYRIFFILIYSLFSSMKYIAQSGKENGRADRADLVLWGTLTLEAAGTNANNTTPAVVSVAASTSPATVTSAFFEPFLPTFFVENATFERASPPENSYTSSSLSQHPTEIVQTEPILPMVIEDLLRANAGIRIADRTDFREARAMDADQSLASCLTVMDDNHRLSEWLAYHYFVMKLRYLVIVPDPASRIYPAPVLDKWRKYITIVEWKDEDFMTTEQYSDSQRFRAEQNHSKRISQGHHNTRQNRFLRQCALHMKETGNQTWVSFHDVDEYYVVNDKLVRNSSMLVQEPSSGFRLLQDTNAHLDALQRLENKTITENYVGPCVTTYRTLYGAVESSPDEIQRNVPSFLEPRRFETLRWRYHATPQRHVQGGKSLLDVSRLPVEILQHKKSFARPHRLLRQCPHNCYHEDAFLTINHYVGSWEYYTYRANDPRRGARKNRGTWLAESQQEDQQNGDQARPWINGFVRYFGEDEAKYLLQDTGLDPNYTAPVDTSWIHPRDLEPRRLKKKVEKMTD
jgi:hypothetical protein